MFISIKTKIWLTIFAIVLLFAVFIMLYFPAQQGKELLKNYNNEVQNLANTVALGVKLALTDINYEGVSGIDFVKKDPRLWFVMIIEYDTIWTADRSNYKIKNKEFQTYPENKHPNPNIKSSHDLILKEAEFIAPTMQGSILLAFTKTAIKESKKRIKVTAIIASSIVLAIGILIGFWLSRNISLPVLALRNAAKRVGEGDLTQRVKELNNDEIGELGKAFNTMTDDLAEARKELSETNASLSSTNFTLNNTLSELKSAQSQLIQSEKMASLGEMTAGIAHEIQNPLNFINNFAELTAELSDELELAVSNENKEEILALVTNIRVNMEKITLHGKRADGIVKSMLQHSRINTGQKEFIDINNLAEEYLRLSYHGLRAQDITFNVTIETNFDNTIEKINVIPQDIGRVLLNIFNNAFFSVNEKKKRLSEKYKPIVSITTGITGKNVEIRIWDNGIGISSKVIDKIYQPFFTTKVTGQGTGLGLSLSYDILKAHNGKINAESVEGEYAEFVIQLPKV